MITLDPAVVASQVKGSGRVTIVTPTRSFEIYLATRDMRPARYRAEASRGDGSSQKLGRTAPTTYAGVVANIPGATARFTIDDRGVNGLILDGDQQFFVEPMLDYTLAAGPTDYLVYSAADVRPEATPGTCGTTEFARVSEGVAFAASAATETTTTAYKVVDLATEADYEYVQALGSDAAANNEIVSIMNQVEGVYQNELGVTFNIVYQHTWTTAADPYTTNNDAGAMIAEFRNYWNSNFTNVSRDLVHMWTGRSLGGSTIGIAYVGVVCSSPAYSYGISQRYNFTPQKYVLSAHEIGHNFNCCHSDTSCNPNTGSCTNTIMQSVVGSNLSFCQFSRDQVNSYLASSSACLATQGTGAPSTIGIYTAATGTFLLKNSNAPGAADIAVGFGPPNMSPVAGDWDANGTTTVGIYNPATGVFFLKNSNAAGAADMTFGFGTANLVPISGDWDGNGTSTIGVYNPATGAFFLKNSNSGGNADVVFVYGPAGAGMLPIVGDWNGDGRDTVGLYQPSTGGFFLKNTNASGAADVTFIYGPPNAKPVAGKWSSTAFDTVGVYVPATAVFFLRSSNSPGPADTTVGFGAPFATPCTGNWDGQ
jgi:hypothetical protein